MPTNLFISLSSAIEMAFRITSAIFFYFTLAHSFVIENDTVKETVDVVKREQDINNVFSGVYTECFLHLSYSCVQRKTLLYLKELNKLPEVSVIGDYVKFVKLNTTEQEVADEELKANDSEELSFMIDKAVDKFFSNHVMKFNALGKDYSVPNTAEEFVGRKRRKGGGGGGGHGGGDDGGKKKMMMMAMMCMKMKLMMMIPAMMGMMGMMSFKGMMFSMMSFMIAKMMLLMKILEKKGGGGGGGGGGGDGGWAAGGGGGGAWMPAGSDYAGGGSGGGYDANGQWQSRSIAEETNHEEFHNKPIVSYVTPVVRFNNVLKDNDKKVTIDEKPKSRHKRGIVDVLQYAYTYWLNRILGGSINRRKVKQPTYRYVNGVKYVYYPMKTIQKMKSLKDANNVKVVDDFKPIIIADDFNKGEIVEGPIEGRMNKKKFNKMKDVVNENVESNPWE